MITPLYCNKIYKLTMTYWQTDVANILNNLFVEIPHKWD